MRNNSHDQIDTRWFRERLYAVGMSQRQLAKHMDLDPAAISLMLRGRRSMSAQEAAEIATLFGVPVQDVVRRAGHGAGRNGNDGEDRVVAPPAREPAPPARERAALMGDAGSEMLDLPVFLSTGATATLRLPRRLNKSDAERIAILIRAFATSD